MGALGVMMRSGVLFINEGASSRAPIMDGTAEVGTVQVISKTFHLLLCARAKNSIWNDQTSTCSNWGDTECLGFFCFVYRQTYLPLPVTFRYHLYQTNTIDFLCTIKPSFIPCHLQSPIICFGPKSKTARFRQLLFIPQLAKQEKFFNHPVYQEENTSWHWSFDLYQFWLIWLQEFACYVSSNLFW